MNTNFEGMRSNSEGTRSDLTITLTNNEIALLREALCLFADQYYPYDNQKKIKALELENKLYNQTHDYWAIIVDEKFVNGNSTKCKDFLVRTSAPEEFYRGFTKALELYGVKFNRII